MPRFKWTRKTRTRLTAILMAFAIVFGGVVAVTVKNAAEATADATHQVEIGMPFAGQWAYNANVNPPYTDANSSHPSVHHTPGGGDWATDVYAAEGTAVKLEVGNATGAVTYSWGSSSTSCGQSTKINVFVDGVNVGWLYFAHLNNAVTSGAITSGMTLGNVKTWYASDGSVCNPGTHVHIEFRNTNNYSCYVDNGHPGVTLALGAGLGVLGSTNTGAQQACSSVPSGSGSTQPPPPAAVTTYSTSDLNADGTDDILLLNHDLDGATGANPGVSTDVSIWMKPEWWHDPYTDWASMKPLVGDVNGDGKADLVYLIPTSTGTQAWVALSTGNSFQAPTVWWDGVGWGFGGIKAAIGDVDANGAEDLVLVTNQPNGGSAAFVLLSTYLQFLSPSPWWSDPGTGWAGITPLVGDFTGSHVNGHMRDDFMFLANSGTGTNAYMAASTGTTFAAPQLWWQGTGWGYSGIKPVVGDVDGNGADDLMLVTNQPNGGSAAYVLRSTYTQFLPIEQWWADPGVGWSGITPMLGDFTNTKGTAGFRRADFAFLADGGTSSPIYVAPSTSTTFAAPQLWWPGSGWGYSSIKVAMR